MESSFSLPTIGPQNNCKSTPFVPSSASVQSRLSAGTSQHRQRTASHPTVAGKGSGRTTNSNDLEAFNAPVSWRYVSSRWLFSGLPQETQALRHGLPQNFLVRWSILLYCLFSAIYLGLALVSTHMGWIYTDIQVTPLNLDGQSKLAAGGMAIANVQKSSELDWRRMSPIADLPTDHLLSKLTSIYPPPRDLEPAVLKGNMDPDHDAITACLWTTETELDMLSTWATRWPGPLSVLLTTSVTPSSPQHAALLRKLSALPQSSPALNRSLSLHILHLSPRPSNSSELCATSPNALLNLARVLSETPRIALFPANLSIAPPARLYRTLSRSKRSLDSDARPIKVKERPVQTQHQGQAQPAYRPTVLSVSPHIHPAFPFAPLAPLVLQRGDPLWCTERFAFLGPDRAQDWEECLWQVWLETFGDVGVEGVGVSTSLGSWDGRDRAAMHEGPSNGAVGKVRQKLSAKFRSETCLLAMRRLTAPRMTEEGVDTKKARWLKKHCRQWG